VLPAQLPPLLLMAALELRWVATNILRITWEVVDGLITLIDHPELPDEELFELIPGPDFLLGNCRTAGIRKLTPGRVVSPCEELPRLRNLGVGASSDGDCGDRVASNKASWIEKVAELVNQGRIEGIADIRDESDRDGMRVVIELKRDTNPQDVLQQLYHQTALSPTSVQFYSALVDGQPRQLSLRQLLQEFLKFREQTPTGATPTN